jgi:hypothetical protein
MSAGRNSSRRKPDTTSSVPDNEPIFLLEANGENWGGGFYYEPKKNEVGIEGFAKTGPFSAGVGVGLNRFDIWGFGAGEASGEQYSPIGHKVLETAGLVGVDSGGIYKGGITVGGIHIGNDLFGVAALGGVETTNYVNDTVLSTIISIGVVNTAKSVIGPVADPDPTAVGPMQDLGPKY